jgi:hypothetical protein
MGLDKRPNVSQQVIDIISDLVDAQDVKGWEKYGVTIDDAKDEAYDWNLMALEETVDGLKYLVKQNTQLQRMNKQLAVIADNYRAEAYEHQQEALRVMAALRRCGEVGEQDVLAIVEKTLGIR